MIEVQVEKMALGGYGIARHQGLVLFIPFAAPGDQLEVRITDQKKNFAFAEILRIIAPAASRRSPPCSVYGQCGGCNFQHLQYETQLEQKQKIIIEHLGAFLGPQTDFQNIVASPQEWNYRNRIQIHLKDQTWGYFARRSHQLIPVQECPIAEKALNAKGIEIVSPTFKKQFPNGRYQLHLQKNLQVQIQATDQKGEQDEDLQDESGSNLGFSQVNRFQNQKLIETVLEWAGTNIPQEIWDLYAGEGNFTFPLLEKFHKAKITAVELSAASVRSAQLRLREENRSPSKAQFLLSDVKTFLRRAILNDNGLILLDPPRSGCGPAVMSLLKQQRFSKILYVSCNPSTMARDLKDLGVGNTEKSNLHLLRLQAFDMFPQTDHIEVLAEIG